MTDNRNSTFEPVQFYLEQKHFLQQPGWAEFQRSLGHEVLEKGGDTVVLQ